MPSGAKKGEARRKGKPNKSTQAIRDVINRVIPLGERIGLVAELARGIKVVKLKAGVPIVYDVPPSMDALTFLESYATGKPREQSSGSVTLETLKLLTDAAALVMRNES